ncbi:transglutaminase, partial [Xanthomonas perforans]
MLHRPSLVLVLLLCLPLLAQAQQRPAPTASAATRTQADTNYSFVRYRADYEVRADASSVETDEYEILLKTKSAV